MLGTLKWKLMQKRGTRICEGKYRRSQILFLIDAAVINAAYVLTSGFFLSGFVIHLNGSDFIVAILNNSFTWAAILSVFSFLIFERIRTRKKLLIFTNAISRFLSGSIVFLPLLFDDEKLIIALLTVMVIIANIMWGIYQLGWMIWYIEVAPEGKKSDYIYLRMLILRIAITIAIQGMGYVLDYYDKSYTGFFIVFVTSLALSANDVVILLFVDEPCYKTREDVKYGAAMFFSPFSNPEFRKFLIYTFFFYLSITISTSFTSIYLIKYLELDYKLISMINVISYILMIVTTRFWDRMQGRKGNMFVIIVSSIFIMLDYLIYSFLTARTLFLLYLSAVVGGTGNGGFNTAIVAYRFELMPKSGKSIYEGWFKAIYGISVLLAPFIGEMLMNAIPESMEIAFSINRFRILYMISFVLGGIVLFASFYKPGLLLPGERDVNI
ncbi:MAG: MFS transporter [Clostridiaceae bacterium]|nr:MFS transporter [Clostridiaceae bacterium]